MNRYPLLRYFSHLKNYSYQCPHCLEIITVYKDTPVYNIVNKIILDERCLDPNIIYHPLNEVSFPCDMCGKIIVPFKSVVLGSIYPKDIIINYLNHKIKRG